MTIIYQSYHKTVIHHGLATNLARMFSMDAQDQPGKTIKKIECIVLQSHKFELYILIINNYRQLRFYTEQFKATFHR